MVCTLFLCIWVCKFFGVRIFWCLDIYFDQFFPILQDYESLLITTWGHDPGIVPVSNVLLALNDALSHSAVLVQVSTCELVRNVVLSVQWLHDGVTSL